MILCFNSGSATSLLNASQATTLNFSRFPTCKIEKKENIYGSWKKKVCIWGPQIFKTYSEGAAVSTSIKGF